MNRPNETGNLSEQILVLAPTGRDAELACEILADNQVSCRLCESIDQVNEGIANGAGAALITEEALDGDTIQSLSETLDQQPKWSEFPIMIFTSESDEDARARSLDGFEGRVNITLVDRPIRIKTLVSAAKSVLRARRHQYEVRDLLQELEQRVHERDQFLAMLGHELRNPLYAIVLASEEADPKREEVAAKLEIIQRQGRRLQRLVDDLLDISRVTRGKIKLEKKTADLCELASRIVEEMLPTAEQESRKLTINIPERRVGVNVDPIRIEQVLTNLIANSLKYTHAGGNIEVKVTVESDEAVLEIEDDGDGIDPELLPHVFDLFTQAGTRNDVHQGGLGIGLTLVKRLIELHEGSIEAKSEGRGKGTTFIVRLPLAIDSAVTAETSEDDERPTESIKSKTVLLIEDNEDIRTLLAARLERAGFHVLEQGNGNDGVEQALQERPDVVVVDIGLPGIDGYEVARRLRDELGDAIHLIAVTGYGQEEDREKAQEAGFDKHLTKPIQSEELKEVISRL